MLMRPPPLSLLHQPPTRLLINSFHCKDLIFSSPIEWLEFQLILWAALQQVMVDDVCSSGEEYNFLVAKALKCRVTIDPIPKLHLAQYAAEAAATFAPLSFGSSLLVPRHASDFPSPCLPSPTPFSLPPPALSPPLVTPSPGTLKLVPPSSSSLPFALVTLPTFTHPSVLPVTSDDYMDHPSLASLALALLRRIPSKNFKLVPPPVKLAATTGCVLRSSCSTPAPPPPVAGPSKPRKHPLVSSSANDDSTNKCTRLTLPPHLTAAQKGKGCTTSTARITTKQQHSLAITKDVHKVGVKGGLGEKTPEDAVELEDPALMLLGLLVPDKDYGDFVGCDSHYFRCSLGDLVGHFALDEAVCIADYQGKVPAPLHQMHAENVENLSGIFKLGVKEWKDLVDVDAELAFETEGEDEDEDRDESS
ncbi:hypothetical protein IW261DRAFT_1558151 [Armillaria novae-zelandiae]|uniref:Uncharacterized protein n=1 Tax=Armillaria novae-zelandiae TaxID=153914 RepID=A0AA39TG91_9AGAR|nr:hypothetical protein IW261DRAFT_1558151 [Armillaria novae-zelandiae]